MNVSDIAASAMLMPPDAEPVMPASALTVIASFTSGFGMAFRASATTVKPGRAAMTPPKPYSEAVFIAASSDPATAALVPSAKLRHDRLEGEGEDAEDADEQRPLDGPDGRHASDLDRCGVAGQRHRH